MKRQNEFVHDAISSRIAELSESRRAASRVEQWALFVRRSRRESMLTLALGSLSGALALMLLVATGAAFLERPFASWHEQTPIEREVRPRAWVHEYDPDIKREVSYPQTYVLATIPVPTAQAVAWTLVGLAMAAPGISRRRVSPLSLVAATILLGCTIVPLLLIVIASTYCVVVNTFL